MTTLSIEQIDMASLTDSIRAGLGDHLEAGYLPGKTILRDAVMSHLGCSACEAEELVETLELQGFIRFPNFADSTHPAGLRAWHLGRPAWSAR